MASWCSPSPLALDVVMAIGMGIDDAAFMLPFPIVLALTTFALVAICTGHFFDRET
ncbi:hypothetical protein [Saccharopolyspora hattusasensis]|uniref:hypothetical protein n=1 Tax=Saccharopolyspora hattusasensis TaxID=1128679 RepID=UPI003D960E8E